VGGPAAPHVLGNNRKNGMSLETRQWAGVQREGLGTGFSAPICKLLGQQRAQERCIQEQSITLGLGRATSPNPNPSPNPSPDWEQHWTHSWAEELQPAPSPQGHGQLCGSRWSQTWADPTLGTRQRIQVYFLELAGHPVSPELSLPRALCAS